MRRDSGVAGASVAWSGERGQGGGTAGSPEGPGEKHPPTPAEDTCRWNGRGADPASAWSALPSPCPSAPFALEVGLPTGRRVCLYSITREKSGQVANGSAKAFQMCRGCLLYWRTRNPDVLFPLYPCPITLPAGALNPSTRCHSRPILFLRQAWPPFLGFYPPQLSPLYPLVSFIPLSHLTASGCGHPPLIFQHSSIHTSEPRPPLPHRPLR